MKALIAIACIGLVSVFIAPADNLAGDAMDDSPLAAGTCGLYAAPFGGGDGCCPHPGGYQLEPHELDGIPFCVGECQKNDT